MYRPENCECEYADDVIDAKILAAHHLTEMASALSAHLELCDRSLAVALCIAVAHMEMTHLGREAGATKLLINEGARMARRWVDEAEAAQARAQEGSVVMTMQLPGNDNGGGE